jgi:hypothetical protein
MPHGEMVSIAAGTPFAGRLGEVACCWSCFLAGRRSFCPPPRPALLASVRLCDVVGRSRRRLAADLVTELDRIDKRIKTADTCWHDGAGRAVATA